jgi:hypothetical protein
MDWVKSKHEEHELTPIQWIVVKVVNEKLTESALFQLFYGRKACPYRVVQRLWNQYDYYQKNGLL